MSTSPDGLVGLPRAAKVAPYRHEKSLFILLAVLAVLFWLLITVATFGVVWIYAIFIYIFALFAHSALIAYLKGNAVRLTETQFPDLHARLLACCRRLEMKSPPEAYLMTGDGALNAFATRFLRRYYVVLLSDIVDALEENPEAINFYFGHELAHIDRKHLANGWWMAPMMVLPILGAAYRRAQEYTCDRYGKACCADDAQAARALAVLAAGTRRWKTLDLPAYVDQCRQTGGFWMSINELLSDYPWLCKRMAHIHAPAVKLPARHPLAWLLAAFLPRFGPGGPVLSILAILGILAAIAIPQYQEYTLRAAAVPAFSYGSRATAAVGSYYEKNEELPASLAALGLAADGALPAVKEAMLDAENGSVTVNLANGRTILYVPRLDEEGRVQWLCSTNLPAKAIPSSARCESTLPAGSGGELNALMQPKP